MGRGAPLPSSSNPEADPFILKENKQKNPHIPSQSTGPFPGPAEYTLGRELERDDGPGSPRLSPAPRPSGSCGLCLSCNLGGRPPRPAAGSSFWGPSCTPGFRSSLYEQGRRRPSRPSATACSPPSSPPPSPHPAALQGGWLAALQVWTPPVREAFSGGLRWGHCLNPQWSQRCRFHNCF